MKIEKFEQKRNTKELLPQVVKRIFAVCKIDPNFPLKSEMESVDNRIESIIKKIKKQDELLQQSETLKHDLSQRLEVLDDTNSRLQSKLLEQLGSEL